MKRICAILLVSVMAFSAVGQSYVEIGGGTSNSSLPYTSWNYSWAKALYTAAQVNGSKTIESFALYYTSGTSKTLNNQKIYMKCVNETTLSGNYEDPLSSGYTLVFDGSLTFTEIGWKTINLTTNFEYDGTKSLVLLWENRTGTELYAGFYATETTENVIKVVGGDSGVPASNGWDPYPKALPNIRFYYQGGSEPETPQNEVPANNSTKVNIDIELAFDLGENTSSYDLYLSNNEALVTSMDESARIVFDEEVAGAGTYTYNHPEPLESKTSYFWRIVAKGETEESTSPVFTFETQRVISVFPYNQGFEDNEIWTPGWYGDLSLTDWFYTTTPLGWNRSGELNGHTGNYSATCNPGGTGGEYLLVTPRINLPANHYVSFWWRNNTTITDKVDGLDETYLEVSTDGGESWSELVILSPTSPNEWTWSLFDLSAFESSNVQLRWKYSRAEGQSGYPIFIDEIVIDEMSDLGEVNLSSNTIEFSDLAVGGYLQKNVVVTNTGTGTLSITNASVDAPFRCTFNAILPPGESANITVEFNPTAAGLSNKTLTLNIDGEFTGENTIELSAHALALTSDFFQPFDVSTNIPSGWNTLNNPNHQYTCVEIKADSWAYSLPNVAKFVLFSEHNYPVTLVTPGLNNFDTNQLKFYAKRGGEYDVSIIVGRMANPYDVDSFVDEETITLTSDYQLFTIDFATAAGLPYIGIRHGGNPELTTISSIWVDDISWSAAGSSVPNPAIIASPENEATDIDIMGNIKLQWINGGGEPTGYRLYLGESVGNMNIINALLFEGSNNTSYTFAGGLDFATTYFWKVISYNTIGDAVDSPTWSFTTMADPTVTTMPWSENFDAVITGAGSNYPLGWTVENTNNDGPTWDAVNNNTTSDLAHSSPNAMNIIFSFYDMDDWLITPPLALESNKSYNLSFWYRTMGDMIVPNPVEKLSVYLGTSNVSTAMSATPIYQNLSLDNLVWSLASVEFSPETNGLYYIGFHGHSESFQGYLLVDDVSLDIAMSAPAIKPSLSNIQVYPNPASSNILIRTNIPAGRDYSISIHSITGQIVYTSVERTPEVNLNIDSFEKGIYLIIIDSTIGQTTTKLIVN